LLIGILAPVVNLPIRSLAQDGPADPVVIHVSSSTGVDGQDGLSPETAVKTVRRGQALLRNGQPDRLLLKRGDTFEETFGNWNKSGFSPDAPLVIGAYGDGPRPKVVSRETVFNLYGNQALLHDLVISGLHFVAAGRNPDGVDYDPAAPGNNAIRVVRPVHRLSIEDCRFEFFHGNLILTGETNRRLLDVAVRRCVVINAYSTAGAHSGQGLYADKVDGLTIERCVFDHNGWNEKVAGAIPNIFRHNIYISHDTSDVKVVGNVIADAASHGMQMRSGGVCEGNLFVGNAIHAFMAGERSVFRGNVVVGGRDIDAKTPRGMGLMIAAGTGVVEDNLFVQKPATTGAAILVEAGKWSPPEGVSAEIRNNVVHQWAGNGLEVTAAVKSLVFQGNDVQGVLGKSRKVVTIKKPAESMAFSGNRYLAVDAPREKWFNLPEGFVSPADWGTRVRDDSRLEAARYPEAGRALPADFVAGAREEKEGYTAAAAVARLREAFGKGRTR
jgi:hypothetical protein